MALDPDERAAERDVQELAAAANREHRQAQCACAEGELRLELVAARIDARGLRGEPEALGRDVTAADQEHAIGEREHAVDVARPGPGNERLGARGRERRENALVDDRRVQPAERGLELARVRGDQDPGPRHRGSAGVTRGAGTARAPSL